MAKSKNRWGLILSILSFAFIGIAVFFLLRYPPVSYKALYKTIFPVLGILFSFISFFTGHFSYPRIHNLKVYLTGYLTGITGIAYFILFRIPQRNEEAITGLLLLVFINFLTILILPSYVKYRITKRVTYFFVAVELILIMVARLNPQSIAWTQYFIRNSFFKIPAIICYSWMIIVFLLSILRLKTEFYLGGVFSGCALFYSLIWLSPLIFDKSYSVEAEIVLFVSLLLYLEIGVLVHSISRMEHRISYDPLLQIYNRNYCSKIIEEQSSVKTIPPLAVTMIDIDHFKNVNDTYGHQAGDRVLYNVAQIILREVIPYGIACRYGGEEIIVFFPNKKAKEITPIIENIRTEIENSKIQISRKKLSVTVSCGISFREVMSQSIMDVIHAADKALYRAKNSGRNQIKTGKTSKHSAKKK